MKATGIVRRIDDLGRVVIPKEIRRTMRIREGDPLEIYTEKDGEVIFKKYSPVGELGDSAQKLCETLHKTTGNPVAVTDRDAVISVCGAPKRELMDKAVSEELEKILESRQSYSRGVGERGKPVSVGDEKYSITVASPIIAEGDILGGVVFFTSGDAAGTEVEQKLAQTVAAFMGREMEA